MEQNTEKRTSDSVLNSIKKMIEDKVSIPKEQWLEAAFFLNILGLEDAQLLNKMRQAVAIKKLEIYKKQEKRNVTAVEMEIESLDEYRFMKDMEDKIYAVKELVRIAKKNSEESY